MPNEALRQELIKRGVRPMPAHPAAQRHGRPDDELIGPWIDSMLEQHGLGGLRDGMELTTIGPKAVPLFLRDTYLKRLLTETLPDLTKAYGKAPEMIGSFQPSMGAWVDNLENVIKPENRRGVVEMMLKDKDPYVVEHFVNGLSNFFTSQRFDPFPNK